MTDEEAMTFFEQQVATDTTAKPLSEIYVVGAANDNSDMKGSITVTPQTQHNPHSPRMLDLPSLRQIDERQQIR